MNEQSLLVGEHLGSLGQRRVQGEEGPEPGPGGEVLCEVAAQSRVGRVARRSDDIEAVGRAALDDEDEAARRISAGEGHAREAERRECAGGAACGNEGAAGNHPHLLTNSGLTSSKASPSAGLSARAIAVRVTSL